MRRVDKVAQGVLKPMNPYISLLLGALTTTWGLFILNPKVHSFTTASVYQKTLEFAPEWAWGLWATLIGIGILTGIYTGVSRILSISLGISVWHWLTISLMLWWGDWQNTAGITYMFIGIYATAAYLNVRVNFVKQGIKHIHL